MSGHQPAGPLPVTFTYYTGLADVPFGNAWLVGTWNVQGLSSEQESSRPMEPVTGEDGCPAFRATVKFAASEAGKEFRWKVLLDTPGGPNAHAIPTEENDPQSRHRHRRFVLGEDGPAQEYHLSLQRRLGANKLWADGAKEPGLRFSVWAPNARRVETVLVDRATGYVADDGTGVTGVFPMTRTSAGVWDTDFTASPALRRFADFTGLPYMFRVTRDDGSVVYRTDLYSRQQIGRGDVDPRGKAYTGRPHDLDGRVGASVVVDPDQVRSTLALDEAGETLIPAHDFWAHEFNHLKPLPSRIEDLVVYQLHVGALGFGRNGPGNLADAVAFIGHLESLGVNAVELLPINEFPGKVGWGYGTTHFFAIEQSAGGRDHLKHFVRECHRRGIAVILDVVYNHYPPDAERAQWQYDSVVPERNIWYWYEGCSADYPHPDGGYIDNISTGFAPRFNEEQVRRCFISSAVSLAAEFHVDGFRMDQVTSLHAYAVIHANGEPAHQARIFGTKFLREWNRTLRLVKPPLVTHAEDHSRWYLVTLPTTDGGLGFDAFWYADFYHHLVGGSDKGDDYAKLIRRCGHGGDWPLAMDHFAGALTASANDTVVYASVHDHAGNADQSARNIVLASGGAPLTGDTRRFAEARCRFAAGMTMMSAGTPFFFMGEEVAAANRYTYDTFLQNREDLRRLRVEEGAAMFRFHQDVIRFYRRHPALRSREIDVVYTHNENRIIAFLRRQGPDLLLIVGSLNNRPFKDGYELPMQRVPDAWWKEIFNSDAEAYGGWNIGNGGHGRQSVGGRLTTILPACGFVVFTRVG